MKIGLDLDGTIGAAPDFFAFLARAWRAAGGEVHVVTSRAPGDPLAAPYLRSIGLGYDALVYTWEKHEYAREVGLRALVDDLDAFLACLPPGVLRLRVCAPGGPEEAAAGLAQIDAWRREREVAA